MSYSIDKGLWSKVFCVPAAVVDSHLRLCGEVPLKVLLILLRYEEPLEQEHMIRMLGGKVSAQDFQDAMRYWEERGIPISSTKEEAASFVTTASSWPAGPDSESLQVRQTEQQASVRTAPEQMSSEVEEMPKQPVQTPAQAVPTMEAQPADKPELDLEQVLRQYRERTGQALAPKLQQEQAPVLRYVQEDDPKEDAQRKIKTLGKGRMRLHTGEINQMSKSDENIAYLLQESQSVLGRPLTAVATDTIVALYSYYGMAPDLVLMLLQYCISLQKDSMRYVEKVAASWLENGIDTHEKAEAEILRATKRGSLENKVKAAFGIYDRKLVEAEQKYILTWAEEYKFGIEIITMAFERSVELKGKLSFPYINGILKKWHEKGITTVQQAAKELQHKPGQFGDREASYEISELEQIIRRRNKLDSAQG